MILGEAQESWRKLQAAQFISEHDGTCVLQVGSLAMNRSPGLNLVGKI